MLEPCLVTGSQIVGEPTGDVSYSVKRVAEDPSKFRVDIFQDQNTLSFQKWSGSMLSIFRELAFTTVAGAHTLEASTLVFQVKNSNAAHYLLSYESPD